MLTSRSRETVSEMKETDGITFRNGLERKHMPGEMEIPPENSTRRKQEGSIQMQMNFEVEKSTVRNVWLASCWCA